MRKHAKQQRRRRRMRRLNLQQEVQDFGDESSQKQHYHDHKERPISIQLIVNSNEKKTYKAGSTISGRILLAVEEIASGCNDFSGIHISLEVKETVAFQSHVVHRLSGLFPAVERHSKTIFTLDKEVVSFSSPLVSGKYEFPFSWTLPESNSSSLPSSMQCESEPQRDSSEELWTQSTCQVHYNLIAYLSNNNEFTSKPQWTVNTSKQSIDIAATGRRMNDCEMMDSSVNIVEPKEFQVNSWLRKRGSIELGIESTHTMEASPGSNFIVGIIGRNGSTVPVREIVVQLIETVQWGSAKHSKASETAQRIVAQSTVPGIDLPPAWQPNNDASNNNMSKDPQTFNVNLHLKKNTRDSYNGRMIQVYHSLQVTAVTELKHVINPEISNPINVYRHNTTTRSPDAPILLSNPLQITEQLQNMNYSKSLVETLPNMSSNNHIPEPMATINFNIRLIEHPPVFPLKRHSAHSSSPLVAF